MYVKIRRNRQLRLLPLTPLFCNVVITYSLNKPDFKLYDYTICWKSWDSNIVHILNIHCGFQTRHTQDKKQTLCLMPNLYKLPRHDYFSSGMQETFNCKLYCTQGFTKNAFSFLGLETLITLITSFLTSSIQKFYKKSFELS